MKTPDLTAAMAEIDGHLADLDADLARAGAARIGTAWHTDRVRAREGLVERRARLSEPAGAKAAE